MATKTTSVPTPANCCSAVSPSSPDSRSRTKEEGRRKKEEGRRKKEEGRGVNLRSKVVQVCCLMIGRVSISLAHPLRRGGQERRPSPPTIRETRASSKSPDYPGDKSVV
ncbi:hypothetical protein QUB60_03515 [Microcoleus sp. A2-C5]|uniref:hypothetical protein n=1 Tax=unclassified Microcoleus TaxID=2642155 RepID=UPI002FD56A64